MKYRDFNDLEYLIKGAILIDNYFVNSMAEVFCFSSWHHRISWPKSSSTHMNKQKDGLQVEEFKGKENEDFSMWVLRILDIVKRKSLDDAVVGSK